MAVGLGLVGAGPMGLESQAPNSSNLLIPSDELITDSLETQKPLLIEFLANCGTEGLPVRALEPV
jgi:hypothetical protein